MVYFPPGAFLGGPVRCSRTACRTLDGLPAYRSTNDNKCVCDGTDNEMYEKDRQRLT